MNTYNPFRQHLGKRVLCRVAPWSSYVYERTVDEISPNGKYVKLNGVWQEAQGMIVADVFEDTQEAQDHE